MGVRGSDREKRSPSTACDRLAWLAPALSSSEFGAGFAAAFDVFGLEVPQLLGAAEDAVDDVPAVEGPRVLLLTTVSIDEVARAVVVDRQTASSAWISPLADDLP